MRSFHRNGTHADRARKSQKITQITHAQRRKVVAEKTHGMIRDFETHLRSFQTAAAADADEDNLPLDASARTMRQTLASSFDAHSDSSDSPRLTQSQKMTMHKSASDSRVIRGHQLNESDHLHSKRPPSPLGIYNYGSVSLKPRTALAQMKRNRDGEDDAPRRAQTSHGFYFPGPDYKQGPYGFSLQDPILLGNRSWEPEKYAACGDHNKKTNVRPRNVKYGANDGGVARVACMTRPTISQVDLNEREICKLTFEQFQEGRLLDVLKHELHRKNITDRDFENRGLLKDRNGGAVDVGEPIPPNAFPLTASLKIEVRSTRGHDIKSRHIFMMMDKHREEACLDHTRHEEGSFGGRWCYRVTEPSHPKVGTFLSHEPIRPHAWMDQDQEDMSEATDLANRITTGLARVMQELHSTIPKLFNAVNKGTPAVLELDEFIDGLVRIHVLEDADAVSLKVLADAMTLIDPDFEGRVNFPALGRGVAAAQAVQRKRSMSYSGSLGSRRSSPTSTFYGGELSGTVEVVKVDKNSKSVFDFNRSRDMFFKQQASLLALHGERKD